LLVLPCEYSAEIDFAFISAELLMSTNPYAAPSEFASYGPPPQLGEDGYVKQILFVGIFMIIEGVLELFMFGLYAFYAAFFPVMMAADRNFNEAMEKAGEGPGGMRPDQFIVVTALIMASGPLLAGVARIVGGICAIRRKNRGLAIAANFVGLLSMIGCYCIPTGIATTVYSLVILFQGSVAQAFAEQAMQSKK
jgi:hypothetical protein